MATFDRKPGFIPWLQLTVFGYKIQMATFDRKPGFIPACGHWSEPSRECVKVSTFSGFKLQLPPSIQIIVSFVDYQITITGNY